MRAVEEHRAVVLWRALRELHAALRADPLAPRELVEVLEVPLVLLGEDATPFAEAARKAAAIRAQRVTWEHTALHGTIAVDWRLNAPQGLYTATPALRRLWLATRVLQLHPVRAEDLRWIAALRIAFESEIEVRDAARELSELQRCHDELWGPLEEATVWETRGAGGWSPKAIDEEALVVDASGVARGEPVEADLWSALLRRAIDVRVPRADAASLRERLLDLLALWPKALVEVPLLAPVEPRFWSDLDRHARGALYLALRESDMLATSGPATPSMDEDASPRVIVEPRPRLYAEILELLAALETLSAKAEARGVSGMRAVRRRIEQASRFTTLCAGWVAEARDELRDAERERAILSAIRDGLLAPRLKHAHARLAIAGAGWMERAAVDTVSVLAADGRRYTGARWRIASER